MSVIDKASIDLDYTIKSVLAIYENMSLKITLKLYLYWNS